MVGTLNAHATLPRAPSLARDAVACVMLFAIGNTSASVLWQHYFSQPTEARGLRLSTYAATPVLGMPTETIAPQPTIVSACVAVPELTNPAATRELPPATDANPDKTPPSIEGSQLCPALMRFVDGMHCPNPVHECIEYLSVARDRCKEYAPNPACGGVPSRKQFCIDEFEFPNQPGALPMVWVSYRQAAEQCAKDNKRLCTSSEWELACEGPQRLPYATGYRRDPTLCNFDRPNLAANINALANPRTRDVEFARIDQREPSGARPDCVSHYGVHDMTGNVDEWVQNESGSVTKPPYRSALKGGYWGRVRNRCRPTTTDHNEWHHGYQVGFRCCADPQTPSVPIRAVAYASR